MLVHQRIYQKKTTGSSECCWTRAPGRCWLAPRGARFFSPKRFVVGSDGRKTQTPHVYGRITMVFYGLWFMVYGLCLWLLYMFPLPIRTKTSNLCCGLRSTGQAIQGFLPGDWALPLSWNLKNRPLFLANYDVWLWFTICDAKPERFLPCSTLFNQPCLRSFSGVTTWKFHGTQQ